jgi:hypothetical protein
MIFHAELILYYKRFPVRYLYKCKEKDDLFPCGMVFGM